MCVCCVCVCMCVVCVWCVCVWCVVCVCVCVGVWCVCGVCVSVCVCVCGVCARVCLCVWCVYGVCVVVCAWLCVCVCVCVCVGGGSLFWPSAWPSVLLQPQGEQLPLRRVLAWGKSFPQDREVVGFPVGTVMVGRAPTGLGIQVTSYPSYILSRRSGIQATYSMRDSPCGDKTRL